MFDMKATSCEVQMALMAINAENSMCRKWQFFGWLLSKVAIVRVAVIQVVVFLEPLYNCFLVINETGEQVSYSGMQ